MRFHMHGQKAESLARKPLVVPQLQCAVLGTSLSAQDTSDRIENSFVLFSCRRLPARSPKVIHAPRQPFPGATSWSSHHVFPAERGCAATRWPFHSRTRGLRPACSAEPEDAGYGGSAPTPLHLQAPAPQLPAASPPAGPDLSPQSARRARSTRLRGADRRVTHSEAPPQWPRSPVALRTPSAATAGSSPKLIARSRPLPALYGLRHFLPHVHLLRCPFPRPLGARCARSLGVRGVQEKRRQGGRCR